MSHARKSLESLLVQPGKRRNTGSHDGVSYFHTVQRLLVDIEAYRTRGYSLGEIYGALLRGGDIGCALSTFKTYYYRLTQAAERRLLETDGVEGNVSLPQSSIPTERPDLQSSTDPEPINDRLLVSVDETSNSPLSEAVMSEQTSLLDVTDQELETQQALARRLFDQRRAELGIRRREH